MADHTGTITTMTIFLIYLVLALFGGLYAVLVYWLGDRKDGYVAWYVVGGVLATIAGMHALDVVVDWPVWVIALSAFATTGAPMIFGEWVYYRLNLERKIDRLYRIATTGNTNDETNEAP